MGADHGGVQRSGTNRVSFCFCVFSPFPVVLFTVCLFYFIFRKGAKGTICVILLLVFFFVFDICLLFFYTWNRGRRGTTTNHNKPKTNQTPNNQQKERQDDIGDLVCFFVGVLVLMAVETLAFFYICHNYFLFLSFLSSPMSFYLPSCIRITCSSPFTLSSFEAQSVT